MPASSLDPQKADQWKEHLDTLAGLLQGRTQGGGATAVAHQRFFGYADAEKLRDLDKTVGTGQCVALIQEYVKGIGSPYRSPGHPGGQPGPRVKDMAPGTIPKSSVIATFWNGAFPQRNSGQHAAFYLGHDAKGIKVAEQWLGTSPKAAAKIRGGTGVIYFNGKALPEDQSGAAPNMSNIGEYYYLVLDNR
jgi:hypothetical protein